MTISRPPLDPEAHPQSRWATTAAEPAWHAGSGMLAGVLLFGGLGWLVGHWLHSSWPVAVGVVLGAAVAMVSLWFRYGVERPGER